MPRELWKRMKGWPVLSVALMVLLGEATLAWGTLDMPPAVMQGVLASVLGAEGCYCYAPGESFTVSVSRDVCFCPKSAACGESIRNCVPEVSPYLVGDTICFGAYATDSDVPIGESCDGENPFADQELPFWRWLVKRDGVLEAERCGGSSHESKLSYTVWYPGNYTFELTVSDRTGTPNENEPCEPRSSDPENPCEDGQVIRTFSLTVREQNSHITFDKEFLLPDGESTATATLQNRIGTPVTWSLVGDTRGARISPSTGVITAGKQCGWITVRATEAARPPINSECERFFTKRSFRIDCSACGSEGCSAGAGEVRPNNADANFSLGAADADESAGKLWVYETQLTSALGTPSTLHFDAGGGSGTQGILVNGVLRQVLAPQVLADVHTLTDSSYRVAFYGQGDVVLDPPLPDGTYSIRTGAIPRVTWKFEYENSQLTISKLPGGAETASEKYIYSGSSGGITLARGDGTDTLRREDVTWDTNHQVRTTSIFGSDQTEVYHREDTFANFAWGETITQSILGDGANAQITTYSYYDDPQEEGKFSQIKLVTTSDGAWRWYDYDTCGRVSTEVSTWLDAQLPDEGDPDPDGARAVYYSYEPVDQRDTPFGDNLNSPRTVTEKGLGITTAKTYYAYYVENGKKVEVVEQCASPTSIYGASTNLRTVTTYVAGDDKKILSIEYPDGRLETRSYETGAFTHADYAGGGDPANAFVPGEGGYRRTTIKHGTVQSPDGIAGKTTMDKTVTSPFGVTVLQETHAYDGTNYERIDWTAYVTDDFDHVTNTYRSDGTHTSRVWGCCHPDSETDAYGITTTFLYDALGRMKQQTKCGVAVDGDYPAQADITTTYTYDGMGRLLTTTTTGDGATLTTSRTYDTAGQLLTDTDQAGLTTGYTYETIGSEDGGGRRVITTPPGLPSATLTYYPDGRVKSNEGPTLVAQYYQYGVTANGRQWTQVNTGSADSPRYVKTWTDILGREVQEERPGYPDETLRSNRYYDDEGRLARTTTSRIAELIEPEPIPDPSPAPGGRGGGVVLGGGGSGPRSGGGGGTLGGGGATGGNVIPMGATILYEYDEVSNLIRSGSDLDGNGSLGLATYDRITETTTSYVKDANGWWLETVSKAYPELGSSAATTTDRTRQRLTGLSTGVVRCSESYDVHGNLTTSATTINRPNKLAIETVNVPDSDVDAVTVIRNGLVQSTTSSTGLTYTYGYDGLGRQTSVTDQRTGTSTTHYKTEGSNTGRVDYVDNAHGDRTRYEYDGAGRIQKVFNAADKYTQYAYNPRGQVTGISGDVPYPTDFQYNNYGERTKLGTYRASGCPQGQDCHDWTTWSYDEASGLLESKTYADGKAVTYDYTPGGKLKTRTWARQAGGQAVVTTYSYSDSTGELTGITYSDDTPAVTFAYDRLGRVQAVEDALGNHAFGYDQYLQLHSEALAGQYYKTVVYEHETAAGLAGRLTAITAGDSQTPSADYSAGYFYDGRGRMDRVTGPGLPAYGAVYGRATNPATGQAWSELVGRIDFRSGEAVNVASTVREFEEQRDLLAAVENKWSPGESGETLISRYGYVNDNLARRTGVVRTGTAFAGGSGDHFDLYEYNDRSELTGSRRFAGAAIPDPLPEGDGSVPSFAYEYDRIGSRKTMKVCGAESCPPSGGQTTTYTRNALNQYTATSNPAESFAYDFDGNLTADGSFAYAWDAENRLVSVAPASPPVAGDKKLVFTYDYMSRRVRKRVFDWDPTLNGDLGGWTAAPSVDRRFVYDGWNLLYEAEYASGEEVIVRKYTWGLDLSGSRYGAGGIGGLLAMQDTNGTPSEPVDDGNYLYFYDGNGNVGQLVDIVTGAIAARYEYNPFGNALVAVGEYASANPFRFSTKYADDDTGLYYYGYRYYSPRRGRWINRDPVGEEAGSNLYAFLTNQPPAQIDPLGQMMLNQQMSTSDCEEEVKKALKDAETKNLHDQGKGGKDGLGIACLGKIKCIDCLWPGIGGGYNPFSRDVLLCKNRLSKAAIKDVVHHELAHAVGVCGWWKFGCENCMREEKRAYFLSGRCKSDRQCSKLAWCSCKSNLSCFDLGDKFDNYLGVGWPPKMLPDRGYRPRPPEWRYTRPPAGGCQPPVPGGPPCGGFPPPM